MLKGGSGVRGLTEIVPLSQEGLRRLVWLGSGKGKGWTLVRLVRWYGLVTHRT